MANPRRAATIRTSKAAMAADVGPRIEHYNMPLDFPRLYKFVVGSTATADGVAVLDHNGGTAGKWLLVRTPVKGDNLTNADATIHVGGGFWRVLPASTLSDNRVLTLGTTNAAEGDVVTVTRLDAEAYTYAIANGGGGGGTLTTFASATPSWADFYYDGTNWSLMRAGEMP